MKKKVFLGILVSVVLACVFFLSACGDDILSGPRTIKVGAQTIWGDLRWSLHKDCEMYEYDSEMYAYTPVGVFDADGVMIFTADGYRVEGTEIVDDMRLYECYEAKALSLSYDANGGSFSEGSTHMTQEASYGENLTLREFPIPTYADPSYEFDGWFLKNTEIRFTTAGTAEKGTLNDRNYNNILQNGGLSLVAAYKQKQPTVTIDLRDGASAPITLTLAYGVPMPDLTEYESDDGQRAIIGWSLLATEQVDLPEVVTEDITVYAVWGEYREVRFVYPSGEQKPLRVPVNDGIATLPADIDLPGYGFYGWHADALFSGNAVTAVAVDALCEVYYGNFRPVSYTLNLTVDGEPFGTPITYYYGDTIYLPTVEREGYIFLGYVCDGVASPFTAIPKSLYGDKVLSAVFEAEKYGLTLHLDGGNLPTADYKIAYGNYFNAPVPTRYGYSFLGWYSAPSGEAVRYTNATGQSFEKWMTADDGEFYARWTLSSYSVIYRTDGGDYKTQQYMHGDTLVFPTEPTKEKRNFGGWVDENGREYTERTLVTSDMTLEALWLDSVPISTPEELAAIKNASAGTYHLVNDINLAGATWTPIPEFSGTLDGCGYKIYNFALSVNVNNPNGSTLGFIGNNRGTIKNLTISEVVIGASYTARDTVTSSIFVGVLAGRSTGAIINCAATDITVKLTGILYPHGDTCTTTQNTYFGGIAGEISDAALIDACHADITLQSTLTQNQIGTNGGRKCKGYGGVYIGGITGQIGSATALVRSCTTKGHFASLTHFEGRSHGGTVHAYNQVAGIAARNRGTILDCYTYGTLEAKCTDAIGHDKFHGGGTYVQGVNSYASAVVGGIAAENYGSVRSCLSSAACGAGSDPGQNSGGGYSKVVRVGGIVAVNHENALVENVRSFANASAHNGNDWATGSIVGYNAGRIKSSVAGGEIYSKGAAGGLVGVNALTGTVMNSISFADLEFDASASNIGIFVGKNSGMMQGCAYDTENSCVKNGANVGRETVDGVAEMGADDIRSRDFLLYELALADSAWNVQEGKIPTLHFEMLYPDIPD